MSRGAEWAAQKTMRDVMIDLSWYDALVIQIVLLFGAGFLLGAKDNVTGFTAIVVIFWCMWVSLLMITPENWWTVVRIVGSWLLATVISAGTAFIGTFPGRWYRKFRAWLQDCRTILYRRK